MERIRNWNRYQKVLALALCIMLVVFTVLYCMVTSRIGFEYKDKILRPQENGGSIVYTGRIKGESARFTVAQDKTVTFSYGDKLYGPYTAREDPSAIPEEEESSVKEHMKGVEIRCGEEIFFRGGVLQTDAGGKDMMLFDENVGLAMNFYITAENGTVYDSEGNEIDLMAPSAHDILQLLHGPELESKGEWLAWLSGVFLSVVTVISMLFADEIFRWSLRWTIRNADKAEPSDWEITSRYIGWMISTVAALVVYIVGLTA